MLLWVAMHLLLLSWCCMWNSGLTDLPIRKIDKAFKIPNSLSFPVMVPYSWMGVQRISELQITSDASTKMDVHADNRSFTLKINNSGGKNCSLFNMWIFVASALIFLLLNSTWFHLILIFYFRKLCSPAMPPLIFITFKLQPLFLSPF